MKKIISLLLTMTMVVGMTVSVGASQVITFDDEGTGTVTTTDTAEDVAPNVETPAPVSTTVKGYIALGSDLSQDQLNTVLALMNVPVAELGNYNIVYVTNADEHASLDKYIASSVIGTRSLSSVLVKPAETGHGVVVTTQNINYCTTNMYRNALITAGVTDADIMVVAPTQISGTAALIGALRAYENMTGKTVANAALDTALNELVTTGEISESVGNSSEAEELISYVKAQIAANDLNTEEEIEAAIRQGMKDLNVSLTEEEISQIVNLMMKIKAMGIDFSVLADQADDIYAKYKDRIDAGTFTIDDINLEDLGLGKIIAKSVGNFFGGITDSIKEFFGGFFKKRK